ncbi:sensor histidine kinase [uncultured Thalassolituus sp.]|uniref:sensor histidine kinase n=2 Tax=uncultured Thalassolituus sp. TaxID=285273 RepID=UPI002627A8F6|nr:ATP-binding protein [uncultured Thalassolituus sp.]
MMADDYKDAYLREKELRKLAEQKLEDKSRELYESFEALKAANSSMQENQKAMVHNEKMASLGVLSAGVAHEINNPIGFIYSNFCTMAEGMSDINTFVFTMDQLVNSGADAETIRNAWREGLTRHDVEYLLMDFESLTSETIEGLERVKQIVADLKSFTREDSGDMDMVDVNECVRGAVNILSNQTKYHAQVIVDYADDLPKVRGYFGKLNQVFTNMIANANQAVSENGEIHITTRMKDERVEISFRDNGCGISETNMKLLFTPFFTTKPVGQGTGLGLSISHGFIEEHNGEIRVESEIGVGTTFLIYLPAADQDQ